MSRKFPLVPAHPERTCWGCDRYCAATALACGNGSERTQHPAELFGPDWFDWQPPVEGAAPPGPAAAGDPAPALDPSEPREPAAGA